MLLSEAQGRACKHSWEICYEFREVRLLAGSGQQSATSLSEGNLIQLGEWGRVVCSV